MREETPTVLGPLERVNINHWTTHVTFVTAIEISETMLCRKGITDKYAIKIVVNHEET
jgi:hypothetical protein